MGEAAVERRDVKNHVVFEVSTEAANKGTLQSFPFSTLLG